jgi:hypothetical protein
MVASPVMLPTVVVTVAVFHARATVVEATIDALTLPVKVCIDPVTLAVEVSGNALPPGAQVVGQARLAKSFGPVGPLGEAIFDAVALAVEVGIDAIALAVQVRLDALAAVVGTRIGKIPMRVAVKAVIIFRRCGSGAGNGDDQDGNGQKFVHGVPPRVIGRWWAISLSPS